MVISVCVSMSKDIAEKSFRRSTQKNISVNQRIKSASISEKKVFRV